MGLRVMFLASGLRVEREVQCTDLYSVEVFGADFSHGILLVQKPSRGKAVARKEIRGCRIAMSMASAF